MKSFNRIAPFILLSGIVMLTTLSACTSAPAETITSTATAWKTSTMTNTVSVTTTVTTTLPVTTTITHTASLSTTSSTTSSTQTTNDKYSNYHGYLLDGYPEDIWPVYGSLAIDRCALDIQFPAYNSTGSYVNSYKVVYVTDKTKQEIAEYYNSLLETTDDQSFYDASGTINGYELTARWDDWGGNDIVYLSVLLPNSLNITSNPLHADFPEVLVEYYEIDDLWGEYYACTSNPGGTIIASKMYSHSGTSEEALEFYRALFSNTQDYEETVTEEYEGQSITLTGIIEDISFSITIGVWGKPDMINISYEKPQ